MARVTSLQATMLLLMALAKSLVRRPPLPVVAIESCCLRGLVLVQAAGFVMIVMSGNLVNEGWSFGRHDGGGDV